MTQRVVVLTVAIALALTALVWSSAILLNRARTIVTQDVTMLGQRLTIAVVNRDNHVYFDVRERRWYGNGWRSTRYIGQASELHLETARVEPDYEKGHVLVVFDGDVLVFDVRTRTIIKR